MYQPKFYQFAFETFHMPFGGKLDPNNRWVKLAEAIPWHVAEELSAKKFPSKRGAPALTVRMALGSLITKEKLGLSDVETVEQIRENPLFAILHRTGTLSLSSALRCIGYDPFPQALQACRSGSIAGRPSETATGEGKGEAVKKHDDDE